MKSTVWCIAVVAIAVESVMTQAGQYGDFTYESLGSAVAIVGYAGSGGDVTIPATIHGLPVTTIGFRAFRCVGNIDTITIPDSVTTIEAGAILGTPLSELIVDPLNQSYASRDGVLFDKSETHLIQYPAGRAGTYTIPDSVSWIEAGAFSGCLLTDVTLPDSVTCIGEAAFAGCLRLPSITVAPSNPSFSSVDGVLFSKDHTMLIAYPAGKSGDTYTIPETVTDIRPSAFDQCTLTFVTLPDAAQSIGSFAFGCCPLTSIAIPNNVSSIGECAFIGCKSLTNVVIGTGVSIVGVQAFTECIALTSITIPGNVTSIGPGAFSRCTGMTNITLRNGLTSIGEFAFEDCGNLVSITIPDSVTVISDWAFHGCSRLASVELGSGIRSIGVGAFEDCTSLTHVSIPNGVTNTPDGAWCWEAGAAYYIGLFFGCTGLTNVVIPSSVDGIGNGTFSGCLNLQSVCVQGDAPTLGADVFDGCENATVHYLPGTIGWESTFGGRPTAFWELPHPVILTSPSNFGIQDNAFGFTISWATNASVVVEAATDLSHPTWKSLSTNVLTDGVSRFSDPNSADHPGRVYRLREQGGIE